MQEMKQKNKAYADALEANLFVLEAELEAWSYYGSLPNSYNHCLVLRKQIELIRAELEAVTK